VSQRWEEGLLNRVLADFRPILQLAQQGEEQRDLPALFVNCTNSQGRKRVGQYGIGGNTELA
jgi:hypothetical protein